MPTPIVYRKASQALATYSFADLASGTGYIQFYAGQGTDENLLSNFVYFSNELISQGAPTASESFVKSIDIDFDVVLNQTITLLGKAIINVSARSVGDNPAAASTYVVARIRKDVQAGGSEVELFTNTGDTMSSGVGATQYETQAIEIDISTPTTIKKGAVLRLTIEGWCSRVGGDAGDTQNSIAIAHDPMGRDTDGSTDWDDNHSTVLLFMCPVRIEI